MAKPLVIHTYRPSCTTVSRPPGFGDFLRGTMALHQLAGKYDFDLHVDFSRHPLSHHILSCDPPPSVPEAPVHEFFNNEAPKLRPFLSGLMQDSVSLVTTHKRPTDTVDDAFRTFIQRRIRPKPAISEALAALRSSLHLEAFCAVHLRLGDQHFGVEDLQIPSLETYFRQDLVPEWGRRILVLSDNHAIKNQLSNLFCLPLVRNVPVHLGQSGTVEHPHQGVRDAYLDFLLLSCAERIYQFSVYEWGSGFSTMSAAIFGRPLHIIDSGFLK